MAGGKTFKRDQKRRKEMARKLKQEEKARKKQERRNQQKDGTEEEVETPELEILDPNVPIWRERARYRIDWLCREDRAAASREKSKGANVHETFAPFLSVPWIARRGYTGVSVGVGVSVAVGVESPGPGVGVDTGAPGVGVVGNGVGVSMPSG